LQAASINTEPINMHRKKLVDLRKA